MVQIPYTVLPNTSTKTGIVKLPLIKVYLHNKKNHKFTPAPIQALIDSGADVCFCSDFIAAWLGINLNEVKNKQTFTTANRTTFTTKKAPLTIVVAGKSYETTFYFCDSLPRHTPIILGEIGFFDNFKIEFDWKNTSIRLD
jgi:hypothetical protein